MNELLAHLIGDYVFQSHWMAVEKTKHSIPAILHGITYTIPFLFLTLNPIVLLIIALSHLVIDRFRLANWVARIKNWTFTKTGYPNDTPIWLTTWLMIIVDNTLHLLINHFALTI